MKKKENYRKIYEEYLEIKIPEGFDIHHIDENRSNNDITNLIMLPSELHSKWHIYKDSFGKSDILDDILCFVPSYPECILKTIVQLAETRVEIQKWIDEKDFRICAANHGKGGGN